MKAIGRSVGRTVAVLAGMTAGAGVMAQAVVAQAPAATPSAAAARAVGTVTAKTETLLTLRTDQGQQVTVSLGPDTRAMELEPGSTDLKTAKPTTVGEVAVGDRVLASGVPAADGSVTLAARRLVVMRSTAIAERRGQEQEGWKHSVGGIVRSIDTTTGTIQVASGARVIPVTTTPGTLVRRYAPGSARFADATKSSLAALHTGDQVQVRGERTGDGATLTMAAVELVSGSFEQISGTLTAVDVAAKTVSLKDLRTKKMVTVSLTEQTEVRRLPAEVAARFATHGKAGEGAPAAASSPHSAPAEGEAGARHGGGADLSQVVAKLPQLSLADLKVGDAVMVVGMADAGNNAAALTVLAGVEPILAASPNGTEMALSPWSMSGGAGAGGAEQ